MRDLMKDVFYRELTKNIPLAYWLSNRTFEEIVINGGTHRYVHIKTLNVFQSTVEKYDYMDSSLEAEVFEDHIKTIAQNAVSNMLGSVATEAPMLSSYVILERSLKVESVHNEGTTYIKIAFRGCLIPKEYKTIMPCLSGSGKLNPRAVTEELRADYLGRFADL